MKGLTLAALTRKLSSPVSSTNVREGKMSFLKRLFKRKEKSNINGQEVNDLQKLTKYFESCDENQIKNFKKFQNELKKNPSQKSEIIHEVIDAGIEYGKNKRYEKIVNEYGKAIMEATELNKRKIEEFGKKNDSNSLKELQENNAIFHHLQNKFDIRLLPYDKNTIREAIEALMQGETAVNKIEQLKVGLLYLDDFINFSQFDS